MISPDTLRKLISYNPSRGNLTWLPREGDDGHIKTWNTRYAWTDAGHMRPSGYLVIKIYDIDYRAHRVAFTMFHGVWPKGVIDHINGDPGDNRIHNLRDVTLSVNQRNSIIRKNNTSGVTGVHWDTNSGRWRAKVTGNHVGYFDTIGEAAAARKAAMKDTGDFTDRHGLGVEK